MGILNVYGLNFALILKCSKIPYKAKKCLKNDYTRFLESKMSKTIKQIADDLGVDKQKVYRFIQKNHIKEVHHEAHQKNGVKYYDEAAQMLIKQGVSDKVTSNEVHHEVHQNHIKSTSNEAAFEALLKQIDVLQEQIKIKDEEIKVKNQQIEQLHKILDQEQQLRMVSEQKILQIEDLNPEQKEVKKKWWQFW